MIANGELKKIGKNYYKTLAMTRPENVTKEEYANCTHMNKM